MENGTAWTTLAHLLRPQGRKGEILADLLTDFPEHFTTRSGLTLRHALGHLQPVAIESHWLPLGRNAGRIVLKFEGVDTIEAAEHLAAADLLIPDEQRMELPDEDAQYIGDLLDCAVLDRGKLIGTVHDVQFPTTASGSRLDDAAPLLVVHSPNGAELLIPFIAAWMETTDIPAKILAMRLPEGLLDINS